MVCDPATPYSPFESYGLGWSDFARHYSRNHGCFLFLWVLRWFTSPGSLHTAMNSRYDNPRSYGLGSPIRTSPDHRLLASPRSFSQLTTSFIAYLRQGIHTHTLSSLTIKSTSLHKMFFDAILLRLLPDTAATSPPRPKLQLNLCFVCPSIFRCQRSRLLQQSVKPQGFTNC